MSEAGLGPALLALVLGLGSGVPALLLRRASRIAQVLSTILLGLAALAGIGGALQVLGARSAPLMGLGPSLLGPLSLRFDPLAAFFLVPLLLIGSLGSLYSLSYRDVRRHPRSARAQLLFWGLLVGGMVLLLLAADALTFILGWECMALSAFFLIVLDDEGEETRRAGFVYLAATHVGTLLLFALFALWRQATGSFEFSAAAPGLLGPGLRTLLFLLALLAFGVKAGLMPLHFWLPGAHANAPSHVSAILSGIVLKMGIYGILRFAFLLGPPPLLWGQLLLGLGAASSLLGVAFALAQHDLKRLLAYHSVENIGIIAMGAGLGLIGVAEGRGLVAVLGFAASLLHVWNHAIFKPLLFFGAGAVIEATGTRSIDRLGGLSRLMPGTAVSFLVGAVAISGLPPLNGFASEFLLYFASFAGSRYGSAPDAALLILVPALAATGALALACFVKVYGIVFLGKPREEGRSPARDPAFPMLVPMFILALLCFLIGLGPALAAPLLDAVLASLPLGTGMGRSGLLSLAPLGMIGLAGGILVGALGLFLLVAALAARRRRAAAAVDTWDCGYAEPSPRMQYGASSFARPLGSLFAWVLRPRRNEPRIETAFPGPTRLESHVDELSLDRLVLPLSRLVASRAGRLRRFQQGLTQRYLLYILLTVLLLLGTMIPFGSFFASLLSK